MALRTMPNNIEAEKSVLGACFLSKYALEKACDNLSQEKFFDEKNGKIFAAIKNAWRKNSTWFNNPNNRITK